MPQRWENIEDTATIATPVWLSRRANVDEKASTDASAAAAAVLLWKPLWKSDCQRLNEFRPSSSSSLSSSDPDNHHHHNHHTLYLECGRKTADLQNYTIRSNFVPRAPIDALCSAIWFERRGDEKNKKDITLVPITDEYDTLQMETLYQKAVTATGTLGPGLITSALLDERPVLKDGVTKVRLNKTSGDNVLSLRLIPPGNWLFTSEMVLQRGYGPYVAIGEDVEMSLGPVQHVVFVVHGIGEALFSRKDVQVMGLIEQTQQARMEIQQRQWDRYQQDLVKYQKKYPSNNHKTAPAPAPPTPPHRIEIIPIEWFDTVHDDSNDLMKSLRATTLPTIPALRAIANDVVFDILMYLTPAFCRQVLETVTDQIHTMYETFRTIHPHFVAAGSTGATTITLAGHSLGSVICWDLLAVLKDHLLATTTSRCSGEGTTTTTTMHGASAFATGGWGPPVTVAKHLPFQPDQTIFLGSPLGMFLTLRGAHPALAAVRENNNNNGPIVSSFTLPTKSLYNIFHPSDPVAYRIEPLLYPQDYNVDDIPPALYLTSPGDDVRLHIKAKQLTDVVRKTLFSNPSSSTTSKEKTGWGALIDGAVALANVDLSSSASSAPAPSSAKTTDRSSASDRDNGKPKATVFPLGGRSPRVDYSLQPYMIDNEYISAVTAHSSYFQNADFQNFLIGMLGQQQLQQQQSAKDLIQNTGDSAAASAAPDDRKPPSYNTPPDLSPAFG